MNHTIQRTRSSHSEKQKGFTLIEILLVIALIAILATVTIIALNPARQMSQGKNATRLSNVNAILNAVGQYSIENKGNVPETIPVSSDGCSGVNADFAICKTGEVCSTGVDLGVLTQDGKFMVSIPVDPSGGSSNESTGYNIVRTEAGRVTVCAPEAELDEVISVVR
jgi:prepilin-type N-terminal cleavage/methylation domain-containing protein